MKRTLFFMYGVICYAISMATFAYMAGFLINFGVPTGIDSTPQMPWLQALLIDIALVALFGIQHSVMARPGFKRVWTKFVPKVIERSTYCLFSSALMLLLCTQWQPLGGVIWDVQNEAGRVLLYSLYAFGWILLVFVTFLINHFDLFGLRQVKLNLLGKEYKHVGFVTPILYKYIRHPLYLGWFTIFWATPAMTIAHLIFAVASTAYILIAVPIEERDLTTFHGETYARYRNEVPKFVPGLKPKPALQEVVN